MARPYDTIAKAPDGSVHVDGLGGVVLFRVLDTIEGLVVHIRLKRNCRQVDQRGDPDFYIPWDEFKREVERKDKQGY